MYKIPLSVPSINGNELKYVKECLDKEWVSSAGTYVDLFEKKIAQYTNSKYAIACVNGTAALQVSIRLSGVKPGEEVIIPSLTFIAPVNAIVYNGAIPIFMDSDDFYNIDVAKTIQFIENETTFKDGLSYNKRTGNVVSAIIPVHIWGNACWLDDLAFLCRERNISIIEDASESLGTSYTKGKYQGMHTGTVGALGCLSFNGNKIITTGGGGMILTNEKSLAEKAKYLTTQAKDDPVRYIHNDIGYNFRLTNIQAALGVAQLEQLPGFIKRKKEIHNYYKSTIDNIDGLAISKGPDFSSNNYWINILQIDSSAYNHNIENLMQRFDQKGIQTRPVWKLNHLQKPYKKFQNYKIINSCKLVENSLCLPSSFNLSDDDLNKVFKVLNG
tara:strand:+ start:18999 stop:20156 length:1158 start_codon:yes stop_codon:yes gene_type:complete